MWFVSGGFTEILFPLDLARFLFVQKKVCLGGLEAIRISEIAAREAQSWVVSSQRLAMKTHMK